MKDAVDAWLSRHPEDEAIRRASRQLERAEVRFPGRHLSGNLVNRGNPGTNMCHLALKRCWEAS